MYIISQKTLRDGILYFCNMGTGLVWTKNREYANTYPSQESAESHIILIRRTRMNNPANPLSVELQ